MVLIECPMDSNEKKRIANEKRLKAVKEWKKNQTVIKIKPLNTHKIFDSSTTSEETPHKGIVENSGKTNERNKPKLFDSDGEEADKYEECFNVRPQFDGPHGQQLLEMSTQFSGRFKLDERFREDAEPKFEEEKNEEKEKNMQILQSILGYEVRTKAEDRSISKKRQIRFDPEDEDALKYVKLSETQPENSRKSVKKQKKSAKEKVDERSEPSIPISTERYVEVRSDLKEILSAPSAPFSLTQTFNQEVELETVNSERKNGNRFDISDFDTIEDEINVDLPNDKVDDKKHELTHELGSRYFIPKMKEESFFIKPSDPRLKEGIAFFKRQKPMEEIRQLWLKKRDYAMELFRRKKRTSQRSYAQVRVQTMQKKNAIRTQNFRK